MVAGAGLTTHAMHWATGPLFILVRKQKCAKGRRKKIETCLPAIPAENERLSSVRDRTFEDRSGLTQMGRLATLEATIDPKKICRLDLARHTGRCVWP